MSMKQPPSSKRKLDLASMAEFPDHIIYSILLKLPTKSLVRFSCLSKSWRETIMSSSFAKQHMQSLKEATAPSCNVIFSVLLRKITDEFDFFRYQISSIEYDRKIIRPVRMSGFMFDHNHYYWLARFQSCDGLLCIALRGYHVSTSLIYIWNPAIGQQHKKIRWPQLLDDDNKSRFYGLSIMGFGYDASIDDYKIIVSEGLGAGNKWSARVMSLKENTWRPAAVDLQIPPSVVMIGGYEPGYESNVITLNGDVYWIVIQCDQFDRRTFGLLKFNLTEESFSLLPLPNEIYKHCKLGSHNGSLFLFLCSYKQPNGKPSKVDIWTLQGHETWCKVRYIPIGEQYGPRLTLRPIGFNMSGDVIMINEIDGSLFVCTPKENKFVKLNIASNFGVTRQELIGFDQFMHMDTLVSP